MSTIPIQEAKRRLLLPELMRKLGIPAESIPTRDGRLVQCPWHHRHRNADRNGSFNIFNGGTAFKCFGCGEHGDGPLLISLWLGLTKREAFYHFLTLAGGVVPRRDPFPQRSQRLPTMPRLLAASPELKVTVARIRALSPMAISQAYSQGILHFGIVCGHSSWILTDPAQRVAEARRIDGKTYPKLGNLGERKAHTIKGSDKSWPVGVACLKTLSKTCSVMLVEGGPDLLAAYHFLFERHIVDVLPVSMLGRNTGGKIHPAAMSILAHRKVRIYPHIDVDGGGIKCAENWASQLVGAGCNVELFSFDGLRKRDGVEVKDLNDAVLIDPSMSGALEELLP